MDTKKKCNHCGGSIEIRNPTGECDHLYYPENCDVCRKAEGSKREDFKMYSRAKGWSRG